MLILLANPVMIYKPESSIVIKDLTYNAIKANENVKPKRICFGSYHKDALQKSSNGNFLGKFVVPFEDSIKPIFERETGLKLFYKFEKYFLSIKKDEEIVYQKIEKFTQKYCDTVFLRDCLDLSIALSEYLTDQNELTSIGRLERSAKYENNNESIIELAKICTDFIIDTPYYKNADYVCSIPPSDVDKSNLPNKIIELINLLNVHNISSTIKWTKIKAELKNMDLDAKWETLKNIDLEINIDVTDKAIILIDDLYQSGATMQYVAMRLKEAGASRIYGLAIVKARNNTAYV